MTEINFQSLAMLAVLVLVPLSLAIFIIRRRRARSIAARMRSVSPYLLHDFLLPDGNDGEIHFEYALLTPSGIVVVDTKEVEGNVFGSDAMNEWTVIQNNQRFTFRNPQRGLLDRVAAISALTPETPAVGYIAFTDGARFSKGQPSHVIFFDTLISDLKKAMPDPRAPALDALLPAWETLVAKATVKGVAQALVK